MITCNEACDGSVGTAILQDWFNDKPLFALQMPMIFDDPLANKFVQKDIEKCWKFIEDQTGVPMNFDLMCEYIERQNELMKFEWEKWEVAAKTNSYPINGVAQALYRIYQSQMGDLPIWHEVDAMSVKLWSAPSAIRQIPSPTLATESSHGPAHLCTTPTGALGLTTLGA